MKLKSDFVSYCNDGENLLVPVGNSTGFHGVVRGNHVFGEILELLRQETTEQAIVSALKTRYDAADGAIEQDVAKALSQLREIGAIDE